jgi:hypothetical protein
VSARGRLMLRCYASARTGRGFEARPVDLGTFVGAGGASGAPGYLSGEERCSASVLADRNRGRREQSEEGVAALPDSYYLDESDPDVLVLRRQDGTFVAAFSASGATREGIVEAAKEDYYAALLSRLAKEAKRGSGEGEGHDPPRGTRG